MRHDDAERDALIKRAGFDVLPHRSMECYPCIYSTRADLRALDEERVQRIEAIERDVSAARGKAVYMFRPKQYQGAEGIREVKRWADSERGKFVPASALVRERRLVLTADQWDGLRTLESEYDGLDDGEVNVCDSGMCGT